MNEDAGGVRFLSRVTHLGQADPRVGRRFVSGARRAGDLDRRFGHWKNAPRKWAVTGGLQAEEAGALRNCGRVDQRAGRSAAAQLVEPCIATAGALRPDRD